MRRIKSQPEAAVMKPQMDDYQSGPATIYLFLTLAKTIRRQHTLTYATTTTKYVLTFKWTRTSVVCHCRQEQLSYIRQSRVFTQLKSWLCLK
jgi:hypothetical protein